MALKIRLSRGGSKKRPYYRIVIADARSPRDGKFLEKVGTYNPMLSQDNPQRITLVKERLTYWLSVGAQPTDRVERFLGAAGLVAMPANRAQPLKSAPKKKAQERLKAEAEAKEAAVAAAAAAAAAPAPVAEASAEDAVAS